MSLKALSWLLRGKLLVAAAPLAAVVAAVASLALAAAPARAADHAIEMSALATLTAGQPTVVRVGGVVASPTEFWDTSWIELVSISAELTAECPGDAGSAASIAVETGGDIIEIALRPNADEAGNFANAVGFRPRRPGPILICGYLYNEVGYTWAVATLSLDVVAAPAAPGPGPGPGPRPGDGSGATGAPPVNLTLPWVTHTKKWLVCHPGTWSAAAGSFGYNWILDGSLRRGTGPRQPWPGPAILGHRVRCRVTAYGLDGSPTAATSPALRLR